MVPCAKILSIRDIAKWSRKGQGQNNRFVRNFIIPANGSTQTCLGRTEVGITYAGRQKSFAYVCHNVKTLTSSSI